MISLCGNSRIINFEKKAEKKEARRGKKHQQSDVELMETNNSARNEYRNWRRWWCRTIMPWNRRPAQKQEEARKCLDGKGPKHKALESKFMKILLPELGERKIKGLKFYSDISLPFTSDSMRMRDFLFGLECQTPSTTHFLTNLGRMLGGIVLRLCHVLLMRLLHSIPVMIRHSN